MSMRERSPRARLGAAAWVLAGSLLSACGGGQGDAPPESAALSATARAAAAQSARAQSAASTRSSSPALASPAFFVSPSGSDTTGDGSQTNPWKTFHQAVPHLAPGVTLYARGGTYAELVSLTTSGTAAQPVTVAAYPGESPVIDGASLTVPAWSTLMSISGSYVNASGFEIRNINMGGYGGGVSPPPASASAVAGGVGVYVQGSHVTVGTMTIHHTWAQGFLGQGDDVTFQDSAVHDVAMSNCSASGQPYCNPGLVGTQRGWASCASIASPYKSGKTTHGGTMQRNAVFNCWGEGMSTWMSDGVVIQDNVVYDNWAQNLYINNASHALVQRNLVYNTENNMVGKHAPFSLADEVTIAGTYDPTNPAMVAANQNSHDNTIIDNLIYDAPFSAYSWTDVPGTGLVNTLIANNTFLDVVTYPTVAGFNGPPPVKPNVLNVVNSNSSIVDNIVIGTNSVPSSAGLTFSHNLWKGTLPAAGNGPGDVDVPATGDAGLARTGSTNPGQLTGSYFALQPWSPAIGKGVALPQVTTTFTQAPVAVPPDIGGM